MKQRKSNLELLRIVSMAFIVLAHMAGVGKADQHTDGINLLFSYFFVCGGKLWSSVFVLLSASFSCVKPFRSRSLFHTVFCAAVVTLGCTVLKPELHATTSDYLKACLSSLFPLSNNTYWFVTTYVFLMLLSPWLNFIVHSASKRDYTVLLILLVLICTIPFTFKLESYSNANSNLLWFICLYLIAGYLVRFPPTFCKRCGRMFACGLTFYVIIFLHSLYKRTLLLGETGSLLMLLGSVCFFCAFRALDISPSKWINAIASGSFAVYLIHMAPMLQHFWWFKVFRYDQLYDSSLFIPNAFVVLVVFFAIGFVTNAVCRQAEKLLFSIPFVSKCFDWLDSLMHTDAIPKSAT